MRIAVTTTNDANGRNMLTRSCADVSMDHDNWTQSEMQAMIDNFKWCCTILGEGAYKCLLLLIKSPVGDGCADQTTSLPCLNISLYLTNARRCSWRLVQCFEAGQRTEEAGLAGEKYSIHLNNFPFIKPDCGQLGRGWEGHTVKAKVTRIWRHFPLHLFTNWSLMTTE